MDLEQQFCMVDIRAFPLPGVTKVHRVVGDHRAFPAGIPFAVFPPHRSPIDMPSTNSFSKVGSRLCGGSASALRADYGPPLLLAGVCRKAAALASRSIGPAGATAR
jgi:hypothetical protein